MALRVTWFTSSIWSVLSILNIGLELFQWIIWTLTLELGRRRIRRRARTLGRPGYIINTHPSPFIHPISGFYQARFSEFRQVILFSSGFSSRQVLLHDGAGAAACWSHCWILKWKELNTLHEVWFSNPFILAKWCRGPLIIQTMNSLKSNIQSL